MDSQDTWLARKVVRFFYMTLQKKMRINFLANPTFEQKEMTPGADTTPSFSFSKITPSSCHQTLAGFLVAHFSYSPPSRVCGCVTRFSSWWWQGSRRLVPFVSHASENITCPHFSYGLQLGGEELS